MSQIRFVQEGLVRTSGYQLVQWTAATPSGATTDSLEPLFVIRRTLSGESFERVASLTDFVTYSVNELKCFEPKGVGGNAVFLANPGDVLTFTPDIDIWLQTEEPYTNCEFTIASATVVSGSVPQLKVGNFLQLTDYQFTDADVDRWFNLTGFASTAYNNPVRVVSVLTSRTALIAFDSGTLVNSNETGTGWSRRRLVIDTTSETEPRYFPTIVRGKAWALSQSGFPYASGPNGETSRFASLELFRDRRVTTIHSTLDAAMALAETTKAAVGRLQAAVEQNNTAFLGTRTTDYPT